MRRTKEDAQQTRQSLLDASLTVFSQKGFEATRLEDIAEAAGVTRGAIYHHFGSKASLFMALIEDASQRGGQVVQAAIASGGSFTEITRRILVDSLRLLEEDLPFREVMALMLFKAGGSDELADFQRLRAEQAKTQVAGIASFFQAGLQQSELRPDLDPTVAARSFLAYQNGLSLLWLSNPRAFSIKDSAGQYAEVFLRGIVRT
jgi:TetR/AcrR family acrAB operon transcriptional repressor